MRKLIAIALLCLVGASHGISYTVQVAAVSDQESALSLVRTLLRDGYPAYFVRTTTEAGFVFRIRVGAFQNRGAALIYAEAMPAVAGARPIPALAEAIPAGIMPLAPALLLTADLTGRAGAMLPWGTGFAFRAQTLDPLAQASWYVLDTTDPVPFDAWAAAPREDGEAVRVRNLPLWPEAAEGSEDTPEVRAEFAAQVRRLIATQLGVDSAIVDEAETTSADGEPVLVVVERFRPGEPDSGELVGLADPDPGMDPYGPDVFLVGADVAPAAAAPAIRFGPDGVALGPSEATSDDPAADGQAAEAAGQEEDTSGGDGENAPAPIGGDGWSVAPDAGFARLTVGGVSWRAAVGEPVWASDDLLVTRSAGVLLIYRFDARPIEAPN